MTARIETKIPVVMISSTVHDLTEYRKQAMDACLRMDMFPKMMEHLPAVDADAIAASVAMVDGADIYVGIYAHRYGYQPEGRNRSITEIEYDRAVERGIPRLVFLARENTAGDGGYSDEGSATKKLKKFRERLKAERVVAFFENSRDLRQKMVESLSQFRTSGAVDTRVHYISDIPEPPVTYVAHAYTLLQTQDLIGRKQDLDLLTDWITQPARFGNARVFSVVAIGGMGKSALTWKWFNDIAPSIVDPLAGQIWWSFYESDATFENFVTRTLAYISRRSIEEIERESFVTRESELLAALDREPHVVVMDGLERLLIAYARRDAAHLLDHDIDDESPEMGGAPLDLPGMTGEPSFRRYHLRKTTNKRAGQFLRKLAGVKASRILISTRLYPADLQMVNGDPLPGCWVHSLGGLRDEDALALWQAYGAKGSSESMGPLFRRIDCHPLLIQALAREVVHDRKDPGNFQTWCEAHPDFDPFTIPLVQVKSHVLYFALRGLSESALRTLQVIAAFRMPASFEILQILLVKADQQPDPAPGDDQEQDNYASLFSWSRDMDEGQKHVEIGEEEPVKFLEDLRMLDTTLAELEGRGLLGWDRRANRYDLHPIVRGLAWSGLQDDARSRIQERLRAQFESMPRFKRSEVKNIQEMTPAIELFNTLLELGRRDEAARLYSYQLGSLHEIDPHMAMELLQGLFGETPENLNIGMNDKAHLLRELGFAYINVGRPDLLTETVAKSIEMLSDPSDLVYPLCDVAQGASLTGRLFEAEVSARSALVAARESDPRWFQPVALYFLAGCLVLRSSNPDALLAINRSQRMFQRRGHTDWAARSRMLGVELLLREGYDKDAAYVTSMIWQEGKSDNRVGRPFVMVPCNRLWAMAQAYLGEPAEAEEKLQYAMTESHSSYWVAEEISSLVAFAENRRLQGDTEQALRLLDDVRALAERGRHQLFLADIYNLYGRIAADAGDVAAAVASSTEAYRLSWCDGPPFAYFWGLEKAAALLARCGARLPEDLEPFDQSRCAAMPSVEVNPRDEWHVDEDKDGNVLISGFKS